MTGWWSRRRGMPIGHQRCRRRGQRCVFGENSQSWFMLRWPRGKNSKECKAGAVNVTPAFVEWKWPSTILVTASKCNKSPVSHRITFGVRCQGVSVGPPQPSSCYVFISQSDTRAAPRTTMIYTHKNTQGIILSTTYTHTVIRYANTCKSEPCGFYTLLQLHSKWHHMQKKL